MNRPLYIFLHIVKTGGTTLNYHIRHNITQFRDVNNNSNANENDLFISGHIFNLKIMEEIKKYHDRKYKYITVLRNPADWLVSVYHQDMSRGKQIIPFEEWYNIIGSNTVTPIDAKRNRMSAYLKCFFNAKTFEECIKYLDNFYIVDITKNMDSVIKKISKELNISMEFKRQRVTGKYSNQDKKIIEKIYELTPEMRRLIYEENKADMKLYEYAKGRHED